MAIGDLFRRKKKDDFLDLGAAQVPGGPGGYGPAGFPGAQPFPQPAGMEGSPLMDMGLPGVGPAQPQMQAMGTEQIENVRRSIETLNYKLDALKAAIDSINARLANIESALKASPVEKQEGWSTF